MQEPSKERAILVGLELKRPRVGKRPGDTPQSESSTAESFQELHSLAESAGAEVVHATTQIRQAVEAATLIGRGKLAELAEQAEAFQADVVLFDRDLSPTQLRNLEKALPCKVVDRTQLILDIFAARARTSEGKLQVELAQLNYLLPRLTGRGAEMSRLGGGIGTRGPGETQLETDRRRIAKRIQKVEQQLETVRSHRGIQRRQRQGVPLATIALVGYTNAGKSTLFNRLTGAGVLADAKMFATLDPTVRHVTLPSRRRVLLSDTVGFIGHLPTALVRAFRATLEEVKESALLLHVVDASAERAAEQTAHVMEVLREIGADDTPQLLVLSKMDLVDRSANALALGRRILGDALRAPEVAGVSAATGQGLPELLARIDAMLPVDPLSLVRYRFPIEDTAGVHLLHEHARVVKEKWASESCVVEAEVPDSLRRKLKRFEIVKRRRKV